MNLVASADAIDIVVLLSEFLFHLKKLLSFVHSNPVVEFSRLLLDVVVDVS